MTLTDTRLGSVFKTHQLSEETIRRCGRWCFYKPDAVSKSSRQYMTQRSHELRRRQSLRSTSRIAQKTCTTCEKKIRRVKARDSVKFLKFFIARVAYSGDKFCLLAGCSRSANRSHVNEKRNVYSNLTVNALTSLPLRFQHVNKFSSVSEAVLTLLLLL